MGFDLRDSFETTDGSRPDATVQGRDAARRNPLVAFGVLAGGDAFERVGAAPPKGGAARAQAWVDAHVTIDPRGAPDDEVARVKRDAAALLEANPALLARMADAPPVLVELLDDDTAYRSLGFPRASQERAAGLFWNQPGWDRARIAFRRRYLPKLPALVAHEFAHAVHYLAFTEDERTLIYDVLRPTFGSRAAMDEVFAIYSEHEFLAREERARERTRGAIRTGDGRATKFSTDDKRGPGVYGFTRRQWNENHLFTRFARKLYYPHAPLAGHQMQREGGASAWKKFLG